MATVLALTAGCRDAHPDDRAAPALAPSTTAVTVPATVAPATTITVPASPAPIIPMLLTDASGPEEVAERIAADEVVMRSPESGQAAVRDATRDQQQAYRNLAVHPEWIDATAARVPAHLRATVRDNGRAGASLRALTRPRPSLPAWRIVAPASAVELEKLYREADRTYGVPWNVLAAIHLVETRMGRIRGTSTAGAQGPMQFLPATWAQYGDGGDIQDDRDSIRAAARYLKRNGAPERLRDAVYAYNHSDKYVDAVLRYAGQMASRPDTYLDYWHWQVFYRLASGDVMLPEGWSA